jgi:hypothetical protein
LKDRRSIQNQNICLHVNSTYQGPDKGVEGRRKEESVEVEDARQKYGTFSFSPLL